MLSGKSWVFREADREAAGRIARQAGISAFLAQILAARGLKDAEEVKRFLNPSIDGLHDPFLMKDMDKAVLRISEAVKNGERIIIYGDYDVDGITGTSVLYSFLRRLGADAGYYIPDRLDEGYGLSVGALEGIISGGAKLVITVDCGITALEEAGYAVENGAGLIITDHHEPKENLPEAHAVVNPLRPDCGYPFKELAGVGVVYKLVHAMCKKLGLGEIYNDYLDLVALGTVADVVPLTGENRIIVKNGIPKIENTGNLGLKTLAGSCGIAGKPVTTWVIGFVIAPRINAAGRVGDAGRGVKLFTTQSREEADAIAAQLNDENRFRQETELEIYRQAVDSVDSTVDLEREKVIVIEGNDWHQGIIGIVASRITEKYYRPCILISTADGIGKGSGRSIEGFNLFKALEHCGSLLDRYGGHELAAGLSLRQENIDEFRRMINRYADSAMKKSGLIQKVRIDARLHGGDVSVDSARQLELLAPFGIGNPTPVFAYEGLKVVESRAVGDNRHLKLKLEDNGNVMDAIAFNMGNLAGEFENSDVLDAACSLEINAWNGIEKVQLNIRDIRPGESALKEDRFYVSLDACVGKHGLKSGAVLSRLPQGKDCGEEMSIGGVMEETGAAGRRTAILVNSLEGLESVEKNIIKYSPGIKKDFKICYTDFVDDGLDIITVIVNPDLKGIDFGTFDTVVFWGAWPFKGYFHKLWNSIGGRKVLCGFKDRPEAGFDGIIPERHDLAAFYRYIKANCGPSFRIKDIFSFARRLSGNRKISMNYFKVRRCLDILEEIGVLKQEAEGEYGVYVRLCSRSGKANLEDSPTFRSLRSLKRGTG